MEPIEILFNKNNPFTPIVVDNGTTGGLIRCELGKSVPKRLESSDMEMFENDVGAANAFLNEQMSKPRAPATGSGGFELGENDESDIYQKYKFDRRSQNAIQLPVYASKDKILRKIAEYPAVVIDGSTGCGKSTQVSIYCNNIIQKGMFTCIAKEA